MARQLAYGTSLRKRSAAIRQHDREKRQYELAERTHFCERRIMDFREWPTVTRNSWWLDSR